MPGPTIICGWCGEKVFGHPAGQAEHDLYRYLFLQCPQCQAYVLARQELRTGHLVDSHPRPQRTFAETYVPETVRGDFNEALKCWSAGSVKGFACLARRALDNSAIQLGATGKDLWNRLEDLHRRAIITEQIRNVAHGIRAFGKHGAHPTEAEQTHADPLADLTEADAETIHEFMLWYLNYVYRSKEFEEKLRSDPRLRGAVPGKPSGS